jgi:copper chaperone CopZ
VQLAANAAGWACLGFAAMDPFRPAAALATATALALAHRFTHRSWRVTAAAAALALGLALLPEALEAAGRAGGLGPAVRALMPARAAPLAPPPPPPLQQAQLTLEVDGIKCAACGERARAAVAALPGVGSAAVDWKAGVVRVGEGASGGGRPNLAAVEAALAEAGFALRGADASNGGDDGREL